MLHFTKRLHHKDRTLCGLIEATSQDISHEVKARATVGQKWVVKMYNDPMSIQRDSLKNASRQVKVPLCCLPVFCEEIDVAKGVEVSTSPLFS